MSRMSIGIQIDEKKIQDSNSIFSDSWVSSKVHKCLNLFIYKAYSYILIYKVIVIILFL